MSKYRLKGVAGNIPVDCSAMEPEWMTKMTLKEVVSDADGEVEAIVYFADCGHRFGEEPETKIICIHPGEKVAFTHWYIDVEEGTWNDGCFMVEVTLMKEDIG